MIYNMGILFQYIRKNPKSTKQTTGLLKVIWKTNVQTTLSLFWDYMVFKPVWLSKRIWCLILPFNDDRKIWRSVSSNGNEFGALLTDLPKAFDCIDHSVLLGRFYGYGVSHT